MQTLFILIIALSSSLIIGEFVGYITHWIIHQKWSGILNKIHMNHHSIDYPTNNLRGAKYRGSFWGANVLIFTIPLLLIWTIFAAFSPLWLSTCVAIEMIIVGYANSWFHDIMHIEPNKFQNKKWFKRRQKMHDIHHYDITKNFGIIHNLFDKLFGTIRTKHKRIN